MAVTTFNPFLTEVDFDDETGIANLTVEHRSGGTVIKRVYSFRSTMTLAQIKSEVLSKNTSLNSRPAVIATLQGLIGTEIV